MNFIPKPQLERHRGYKLFLTTATSCRARVPAPHPFPLGPRPRWVTGPGSSKALPLRSGSAQALPQGPAPRAHLLSAGPRPAPVHAPAPRWVTDPAFPGSAPQVFPAPGPSPPRLRLQGPRLVGSLRPSQGPALQGPVCAAPADARVLQSRRQTSQELRAAAGDLWWCCRMPSLGRAWCSHSFRWVPRWAGRASAAPALTVLPSQGVACAGCWSSRADPSSSPSRASGDVPAHPRCACCGSIATS